MRKFNKSVTQYAHHPGMEYWLKNDASLTTHYRDDMWVETSKTTPRIAQSRRDDMWVETSKTSPRTTQSRRDDMWVKKCIFAKNLIKPIDMANTYTQIHIHAVFAVQNRFSLIQKQWKEEMNQYITGIVENNGHKLLQIGGMPDHVHVLIGMQPTQSISSMLQDIKGCSSLWINKKNLVRGKFSWQEGYGAFSYGKSQVNDVIDYIKNQEIHHKKRTFADEYLEFLKLFEIEYDERYVLKNPE